MLIDKEYIIRIRRELHQVPEIGFDLPKTLAIVRRELEALKIPYTESLGKSCIVATLNGGKYSKTIGLRADMDALPIQEETGLPFCSTHPGKMHACGHDCHTAMLLGTAKALKEMEQDIHCCVKFVFQSCEEILGGAKSLCEDGLMEEIDSILACHITPTQPAGFVRISNGCSNASSRGFRIHLHGKACHGSAPHMGVDAIAMAANVYQNLQLLSTRQLAPREPVVIGVGEIHGGTANNIVAEDCVMNCTMRTLNGKTDEFAYNQIQKIAKSAAEVFGGTATVETYKFTPCLMNDAEAAKAVVTAAEKVVGKDMVDPDKPYELGAEDFAYFAQEKPGVMISLGVQPADGSVVPLHNGKMMVNEDALDIAPKVFIQYILDTMED